MVLTLIEPPMAARQDKFGGLKKFLEKYSEDFFVSSDHPFNPHVYLRSTITTTDLAQLQISPTAGSGANRRGKKPRRRGSARSSAEETPEKPATGAAGAASTSSAAGQSASAPGGHASATAPRTTLL